MIVDVSSSKNRPEDNLSNDSNTHYHKGALLFLRCNMITKCCFINLPHGGTCDACKKDGIDFLLKHH